MKRNRVVHLQSKRKRIVVGQAIVAGAVSTALIYSSTISLAVASDEEMDHPAIRYIQSKPTDPIANLQKDIDSGKVKLPFYDRHGYLRSVLNALNIPSNSQMLVFSKTSFQRDHISPNAPRALYFNDHTYIGWVQGGEVLEVATTDPKLGTTFYVLRQDKNDHPKFIRQNYECLQCHASSMTNQIPGLMMRSVYPRRDGLPEFGAGGFITSDASPMKERWGGWFVTGTHGTMRHMGNAFAEGTDPITINQEPGANLTSLRGAIDTSAYLQPTSDIVALMVAEHQTTVENQITRAGYLTRIALADEASLNRELKRPVDFRSESTTHRIASACENLVKGLLFAKESMLTDEVKGTSGFAEQFAKTGTADKMGRSLRQFDLHRRLLKYPCSWLIYSQAFLALPKEAKACVYNRLHSILSTKDTLEDFPNLNLYERECIQSILSETLPEYEAACSRAVATR